MFKKTLLMSAAPLMAMLAASGAQAQQAAVAAPAAGPTASLGEIVVTAQHRSENLQKAAVVVDAVTGANLVKAGITDPTTLSSQVPGLSAPAFGGGTVSYFVRGVGNFSETPYGDPAIAYNYDGIYVGLSVETAQPFYDLQRVEVLKGPQGTLYGRNATGGAINVIPQIPQIGTFGGYVTTSVGNYGAYNVEGAVNAPIGDKTAVRLAANFLGHDAYLTQGMSDADTKSVRAQVLSHLTSALTVRLATDFTDVSGVGVGSTLIGAYTPNGPGPGNGYIYHSSGVGPESSYESPASQAFRETLSAAPSGRNLGAVTTPPFTNNKLYGVNAEINYDVGAGTFTLIPAWRAASVAYGTGAAATPSNTREDDSQESLELRFAGHRVGIFNYTLGALYYREQQKGAFDIDQGPITIFQHYSDSTQSYAAFGRLTTNFTDQLRLVTGFRYSVDEKHFDGAAEALALVCALNPASGCPSAPQFAFSTSAAGQSIPAPAASGGSILLSPPPQLLLVSRTDTVVPQSSLTNRAPTFRVALEYDVAPHSLIYASVETGYRSGGFNLAASSATKQDTTYKPENITAFTLGSKNRFMGNKLELNGELFLWKYRDQQVSNLTDDALQNLSNQTQNIGASTNEGAELESRYRVTSTTTVTANVQYLDAHYDKFTYISQSNSALAPTTACLPSYDGAVPAVNPTQKIYTYSVNCSGKSAFNAPKWTVNLGIEQTIPLQGFELVASADTQYLSDRYVGFDYLPQELAPAVWQSNAQLSLSPDGGRWTLAAYVRNIEGTRSPVNIARFPTGNFLAETSGAPRLYGLRANVKF